METQDKLDNRTLPWVRNGVDVSAAANAKQAMKLAGLDWEVSLEELKRPGGRVLKQRTFAVVRSDTDEDVGTVRSKYVPFQNIEAFTFVDSLIEDHGVRPHYAGQYRGGAVVFFAMKVGKQIKVNGDDFDVFLFLRTSHDGSKAITCDVMPVRQWCTNGMAFILKDAKSRWSVSHVSDVHGRLKEAQNTIELSEAYQEAFRHEAAHLRLQKITMPKLTKIIEDTWHGGGERAKAGLISGVKTNLELSPTIHDGDRNNAWGVLNAFTEYMDHLRPRRSEQAALTSQLDGFSARLRNALVEAAR